MGESDLHVHDDGRQHQWVWMQHPKLCYSPGRVIKELDQGKIEVEAEDGFRAVLLRSECSPVHRASTYGVPNLLDLGDFSMCALLHTVRLRYYKGDLYSGIGLPILIAINPYRPMPNLYNQQVRVQYQRVMSPNSDDGGIIDKKLFLEKPHLFSTAQIAYANLIRNKQAQSIVISGESGAGKTEATKILLRYFSELDSEGPGTTPLRCMTPLSRPLTSEMPGSSSRPPPHSPSGSVCNSNSIESHTLKANPILESFGNAKTVRNDNSSRFGKFIQIHFDLNHPKRVKTARISHYLLEKCRLVSLHPGERNFHVFYELLFGAQNLPEWQSKLAEWGLLEVDHHRFKQMLGANSEEWLMGNEESMFLELVQCLESIGFQSAEIDNMFSVIAGLLHLSRLKFLEVDGPAYGPTKTVSLEDSVPLEYACRLLGITQVYRSAPDHPPPAVQTPVEAFEDVLLVKCIRNAEGIGNWIRSSRNAHHAAQVRDSMIKEVYSRQFTYLVKRINDALSCTRTQSTNDRTSRGSVRKSSTLDMLLSNRKNALPPSKQITPPIGLLDIYGFEVFEGRNSFEQLCINYANEKLQHHFNQHVLSIEQKTYQSESIDWSEIEFSDNQEIIKALEDPPYGIFTILDDTRVAERDRDVRFLNTILYNANKNVITVPPLQQTRLKRDSFLVRHYAGLVEYNSTGFVEKNVDRLELQSSHFLATNSTNPLIQQLFPLEEFQDLAIRRNSLRATVSIEFRNQLSMLLSSLTATTPSYVRCIKPNSNKAPKYFESHEVLRQLLYAGLLESIRIRNSGFGVRASFLDFLDEYCRITSVEFRRYVRDRLDMSNEALKGMCLRVLKFALQGTQASGWQLGQTKVFMKEDVQAVLERARSLVRVQRATLLQAFWRRTLQRRRYLRFREALITLQAHVRRKAACRLVLLLKLQRFVANWLRYTRPARQRFLLQREKILIVQAGVRGFLVRRFIIPQIRDQLLLQRKNAQEQLAALSTTRESLEPPLQLTPTPTKRRLETRAVPEPATSTGILARIVESRGLGNQRGHLLGCCESPRILSSSTIRGESSSKHKQSRVQPSPTRKRPIANSTGSSGSRDKPSRGSKDLAYSCRILSKKVDQYHQESTTAAKMIESLRSQLREKKQQLRALQRDRDGLQHNYQIEIENLTALIQKYNESEILFRNERDELIEESSMLNQRLKWCDGVVTDFFTEVQKMDTLFERVKYSAPCTLVDGVMEQIRAHSSRMRDSIGRYEHFRQLRKEDLQPYLPFVPRQDINASPTNRACMDLTSESVSTPCRCGAQQHPPPSSRVVREPSWHEPLGCDSHNPIGPFPSGSYRSQRPWNQQGGMQQTFHAPEIIPGSRSGGSTAHNRLRSSLEFEPFRNDVLPQQDMIPRHARVLSNHHHREMMTPRIPSQSSAASQRAYNIPASMVPNSWQGEALPSPNAGPELAYGAPPRKTEIGQFPPFLRMGGRTLGSTVTSTSSAVLPRGGRRTREEFISSPLSREPHIKTYR